MLARSSAGPALLAMAIGIAVGVLTSFFQAGLEFPWLALANAVSPWLTTAFVGGALQPRMRTAVWVGSAATVLEVIGYYATAELRGFGVSTHYVVLWSLCALVGGPVFGAAGYAWRRAAPAGIGAAVLVAAYATEALVAYELRLDYTSTAVLFGSIAVLLAIGLGLHRRQYASMVRWLAPALIAGTVGNVALGLVAG